VSTPDYQQALGRKLAAERKRRGLSQPDLAKMIGRSVAWVSQVERGVRRIDRMSVLETLGAALDVPLAELAADAPIIAAVADESPAAGGLRLVLSGTYALRAMLNGHHPPALVDLRERTGKAWELTHGSRYTELTDLLGALIPDLEVAARAPARPRGRGLRADGRRLPGMLGGAGQARRARGRLDSRRPVHDRCRAIRQAAPGRRRGLPAGVRVPFRPALRPGRRDRPDRR
jgi:DNA-binding XRE family transcriptional regulator